MELTVGAVVEGKVKSITNFGAFISLPENKTGMVHISEVANAYVSDIRQHLTEGQDVKVMVIGTDIGKINLSFKRLGRAQQREGGNRPSFRGGNSGQRREGAPQNRESSRPQQQRSPMPPAAPKTADQLFEEKLKAFMSESDSKLSGIKQYADHRGSSRPRRRG